MRSFPPNHGTDNHPAPAPGPESPGCFTQERLLLYLDGKLPAAEELAVETHVETCERCARLMNRQSNPLLRDLPELPEFEIRGVIAFGGMGTIYRAYEHALHREVAIKMMKASLANDVALRERFVNEARISGQLDHANILPVHALRYLPDGRPWLVMKLVRGKTLADLLAHRQPDHSDADEFLEYFDQVCKTVAYAHALGVIHRDLKPSNVMVETVNLGTEQQHTDVFVMDWGLAKELASVRTRGRAARPAPDPPVPRDRPTAQNLTSAGLGTVPYMAPEQARGEPDLDERADVFSLGAILCEILTDEPPYGGTGGGHTSAFDQLLNTAARGDLAHAEYLLANCTADPDLIKLAADCLQEDRERRPRNAGDVAKRVIAYRNKVRERSELAAIRDVTELVEATSRKVESRTRWEVEGRVRQEAEARARAERQAAVERKARERATRKGRRARWIAIIAIVLVVILAGLLGVGYWQYREHTARAVRHELAEVDQILTEAQAAQPDGAVALLTKAQARVDVARQLAVSWLTSDATRDEIARLDRTCKAARAAALFRHADRLIRLRRLGEAADVFEQAFAADPEQPPEQFIKVARTVANVLATVPTDSQTRVRLQAFLRRCIIDGVARYAQQAADAATTAARRQEIRNELRRCLNDDSLVLTDRDIERLVAEDRGAWRRLRADLDAALNSLPE